MKKIGVLICNCAGNISNVINIKELIERLSYMDNIYPVEFHSTLCSKLGIQFLKDYIKKYNVDKLLIAACSPKQHELTFRQVCNETNVNPYCLHLVNIREQCAWIHKNSSLATKKAEILIKIGLSRILYQKPLKEKFIDFNTDILVIGAGIAGIEASLLLSEAGRKVYIIEKKPCIGGILPLLSKIYPTNECAPCYAASKLQKVLNDKNIQINLLSEVIEIKGFLGNFEAKILKKARYISNDCIGCGECISVCPVAVKNEFNEFLDEKKALSFPYPGCLPNIPYIDKETCLRFKGEDCNLCQLACPLGAISFDEIDEEIILKTGNIIFASGIYFPKIDPNKNKLLHLNALAFERLASQSGPTNGCISFNKNISSIAIIIAKRKNALSNNIDYLNTEKYINILKDVFSEIKIYVFDPQRLFENNQVEVIYTSPIEIISYNGKKIILYNLNNQNSYIEVDAIIENRIAIDNPEITKLMDMLFINGSDCYDKKDNYSYASPIATNMDGVYIIGGLRNGNNINLEETLLQAHAACGMILSKSPMGKKISIEPEYAVMDKEFCSKCKICYSICPFIAIEEKNGFFEVSEEICRGCGICAVGCPSNLININYYYQESILAEISTALSQKIFKPTIIAFLCNWCSYLAADLAGAKRLELDPGIIPIRVPCSGRVDTSWILEAIKRGADGVAVFGCHPNSCHYRNGNYYALKRITLLKKILPSFGIDPGRVIIDWASSSEGDKLAQKLSSFVNYLKKAELSNLFNDLLEEWQYHNPLLIPSNK